MEKTIICIVCPKGCHITYKDGTYSGYTCPRGLNYAKQEMISPERILTTTVKVKGKDMVIPVKSSGLLPKGKMFDVMKEVNKVNVSLPIKMHDVIIKNVLGLGVDIIATKEVLHG